MPSIQLIQGDITQARTDAIVNAANSIMLGGGGVDGAIHRAAGPKLVEACRRVPKQNGIRCPVGEARITPGFDLPASWVIHTVGPRYRTEPNPAQQLRSCYENALQLAHEHACQSIAFPAISCGAYGYPLKEAANIAVQTCQDERWKSLSITFFLFDSKTFAAWQKALVPPLFPT